MTNKIIKQLAYIILLIIQISLASATDMTLEELIASYDYDFYNGTINVTIFDDYMIDQDSNGVNDTLIINLTTDTLNTLTCLFIVNLNEKTDLIQNYTNKTISSSDQNAQVSFDSKQLTLNQYNYSVEIRRQDYSLAYMKYNIQTNYYSNYEQGISVNSISDQSIDNNLIRITLNLSVTENKTANITAYLNYNNKTVSATKEETLTTPTQLVDIDFDNATITLTHYNGVYSLESVKIADKIIDIDYNTSSYNYEDFAKTSYIKSITSGTFDNNSNNLSEALQFNFTLNINSSNTYTIEATLYDSSDNYITTISKNETLNTGTQTVTIEVPGGDIYSTYYNGEVELSFAKLSIGNNTKDIIYNAHTTSVYYYSDFERPPLADLIPSITIINSSTANVTVTNTGEVPAFNIIVDIFDDDNFSVVEPISYLNVSKSQTIPVNLSSNYSVLTAIVDFNNYVDESNESNNIAQNIEEISNLTISSLTNITINNTHMLFEFVINNTGSTTLNNINWTFDAGDGSSVIASEDTFSLASGSTALVFIEYNYSTESIFIVNATANSGTLTASRNLSINLGNATNNLDVYDFSMYNVSSTHKVFSFMVKNIAENQNLTDISWSLNSGLETISSNYSFNLTPNNFSFVFAEYNYTQTGDFTPIASATSGSNQDSETLPTIDIPDIEVSNLSLIYNDSTHRIFFFTISNMLSTPMNNVNWTFDTDDNNVITANQLFSLNESKEAFVFVEYNYSSADTYTVNATAINGSLQDSITYGFTI